MSSPVWIWNPENNRLTLDIPTVKMFPIETFDPLNKILQYLQSETRSWKTLIGDDLFSSYRLMEEKYWDLLFDSNKPDIEKAILYVFDNEDGEELEDRLVIKPIVFIERLIKKFPSRSSFRHWVPRLYLRWTGEHFDWSLWSILLRTPGWDEFWEWFNFTPCDDIDLMLKDFFAALNRNSCPIGIKTFEDEFLKKNLPTDIKLAKICKEVNFDMITWSIGCRVKCARILFSDPLFWEDVLYHSNVNQSTIEVVIKRALNLRNSQITRLIAEKFSELSKSFELARFWGKMAK